MPVESFTSPGTSSNMGYVTAVLWEGVTTAGDTVQLINVETGGLFWAGRANATQTYQGITFPDHGQKSSKGIQVSQISSGRVYVYFREN